VSSDLCGTPCSPTTGALQDINFIIKFVDDNTVVGLVTKNDESAYREEVSELALWCLDNNHSLNFEKQKS
jgi:hypothetical protein